MLDLEPSNCFCGFLYQIEKNNSKIVSLEKIENVSNLLGSSREDREYREVALIAENSIVCIKIPSEKWEMRCEDSETSFLIFKFPFLTSHFSFPVF